MRVVYKYPLEMIDVQNILMHGSAEILHVDVRDEDLYLWAIVDPDKTDLTWRKIRIAGTGHGIDEEYLVHLGTVLVGNFVWHVFLVLE